MSYSLTLKIGRRSEMTTSLDELNELKLTCAGVGLVLVPDYAAQKVRIYTLDTFGQHRELITEVAS